MIIPTSSSAGLAVAAGTVERGVAVCGSGVGRIGVCQQSLGVRAGLVGDHFSARQGVEDDHMNVICMGGRTVGPFAAWTFSKRFWPPNLARSLATCAAWQKVAALEPDAISSNGFEAKEKP